MSTSTVAPRRAQRADRPTKGDRRERALLDASARMLAAGRFAEASVAEIADEADLSRAAFYFYFASKQALLATLIDEAVTAFNADVLDVARADHLDPAAAVRATVDAAAQLWWNHADVLRTSVELGATNADVYDRTMANIAVVREPTVALLLRHGTVAEARDEAAAVELVTVLILMCERSFYDLVRTSPSPADLRRLTDRLAAVWLRAFGIAEAS